MVVVVGCQPNAWVGCLVLATYGMAVVDVQVVLLMSATCEIVLAECAGVLFGVSHMCGDSSHVYYCVSCGCGGSSCVHMS